MDKSNHEYPSTGVEVEDDTTHKRNYDALKQEATKPNPKADILMDMMKRTFGRRRLWILESERLVLKICEEYPPLKKSPYVSPIKFANDISTVTITCTLHSDCAGIRYDSGQEWFICNIRVFLAKVGESNTWLLYWHKEQDTGTVQCIKGSGVI